MIFVRPTPPHRNCHRGIRKAGFSLLEMIMATILLTIGLLAIMQAFSAGLSAGTQGENNLTALHLAQEKLEESRGNAFSAVIDETRAANEPALGVFGSVFDREMIVIDSAQGLKQVEVYVYWLAGGREIYVRLTTYRTDYL